MGNHDMTDSLERPGVLKDVKVVMVGPKKSGKTSLVQRFVNDTFCDTYVPTGFEKYSTKCKVDEYTIQYSIWDTSGSGAYDSVRPLAYQDANVFLLCFNIGDPDSLDQAINKWHPEIISHCNTTPIILCGCRADTKNNIEQISYLTHTHKMPVTSEHILNACKQIQAMAYVETSTVYSSLTVPEAFDVAAKAALGILNNKINTKKQKKFNNQINNNSNHNNNNTQNNSNHNNNQNSNQNSNSITKNNKTNIKNELKGRVKNTCTVM